MTKGFVLVTGGTGFLGSEVTRQLEAKGYAVAAVGSKDYDLRNEFGIHRMFEDIPAPDIVVHCAARVGGIGLNQAKPASLFYDNLMMTTQLMEWSRIKQVQKFVAIGTVCSYPSHTPLPIEETSLWEGYPEATNAAYGLAKRMAVVQAQAMRTQYGFNAITVIPANLYGPGMDDNPTTSHVIPAIIRLIRIHQKVGYPGSVTLWGTGKATRDFLHVRDAAAGVVLAMEGYDNPVPLNLGTGVETSILDVATRIARLMDFKGQVVFDHEHPDGQSRRVISGGRARRMLGWIPGIDLDTGLREMIEQVRV